MIPFKRSFLIAAFFALASFAQAQLQLSPSAEENKQALTEINSEIEAFILENRSTPIPNSQFKTRDHRHGGHSCSADPAASEAVIKEATIRSYWTKKYFEQHPGLEEQLLQRAPATCVDGSFDALTDLTGLYTTENGLWASGGFIHPTTAVEASTFSAVTGNFDDHFQLVTNGADPIVPGLERTNDGSAKALRINSPIPLPSNSSNCFPSNNIDKVSTDIVLTAQQEDVGFYFALVVDDPPGNHQLQGSPPGQLIHPFFSARAVNQGGVVLDEFIVWSDDGDSFWTDVNPTLPNPCSLENTFHNVLFHDWNCYKLSVTGNIGDVITLEFYASECLQGGHFGYGYIDDICTTCDDPITGLVSLDPFSGCFQDPTTITGTYIPPNMGTPTSVDLFIIDSGDDVTVGSMTGTWNTTDETWEVIMNTANFPAGQGAYDLRVEMTFDVGNVVYDLHSNPGPNNDISVDYLKCGPNNLDCNHMIPGGFGGDIGLSWEDIGADDYEVEIINFGGDCCTIPNGGVVESFVFNSSVPNIIINDAGNYHCATWRVRALFGTNWSEWSSEICLCTDGICDLDPPSSPGCKTYGGNISVGWAASPGAVQYQVRVMNGTCPGCQGGNVNQYQFYTSDVTFQLPSPANQYVCATWMVRAQCNDGTWGSWTIPICLCGKKKSCNTATPNSLTCSLLDGTYQPYLTWSPITGATGYHLILTMNNCAGCTSTGAPYQIQFSTPSPFVTLPQGILNYPCATWKVRAYCQQGGYSDWSSEVCLCKRRRGPEADDLSTQSMRIFPNPASGWANVELSRSSSGVLEIYNAQGSLIKQVPFTESNLLNIDLRELPVGLYVVKYQIDGEELIEKLMVE